MLIAKLSFELGRFRALYFGGKMFLKTLSATLIIFCCLNIKGEQTHDSSKNNERSSDTAPLTKGEKELQGRPVAYVPQRSCSCILVDAITVEINFFQSKIVRNVFRTQCLLDGKVTWDSLVNVYPNEASCRFDADEFAGIDREIPEAKPGGSCSCAESKVKVVIPHGVKERNWATFNAFRLECKNDAGESFYDSDVSKKYYPSMRSCIFDGRRTIFK